ncbi:membrane protein [Paractinoplanes rishiriensis]|uniref:Membrane protein n=1 Tax=Paractinoplanes rishiriensis TaxID=1050105 RepID=A0A919KCL3_9ACTN|nr:membrane protein [Actinoplanes rishiriensis]
MGPFAARFSVTPSLSGGTEVQIPPLGSLGLASHDGPAHLKVRLDTLDQDRTFALANDTNGLAAASQTAATDVQNGVTRLLTRSIVAGLLGALLLSAIVFRRWRRVLAGVGVAAATLTATGAITAVTFKPGSIEEPTYHGLLANAPAVVGDARRIADQFTKYRDQLQRMVGNISKVYATFSTLPVYQASPDTIRVLHVSDLHLNPAAWTVIAAVVKQYQVNVVVDTGDINDWGSQVEASFVAAIGALGVPYVYVRGNHDSSITAAAVAAQPNAVVLDNQIATVAGLTFAGIGDPRFTPDKEASAEIDDVPGLLDASGSQLAATVDAAGTPVDIALVHDPASAGPLNGAVPLVLAGHRHTRKVSILAPVSGRSETRLMVSGSTGGAGLRGLEGDTPTPLEMTLIYLDPSHTLQAYDEITVGGSGTAEVTIRRRLAADDPDSEPATPASPQSHSASPAPLNSFNPSPSRR